MPYRIHWEGHGVYRRFEGVVGLAEFQAACEEVCGDVRFDDVRYVISDYLNCRAGPDFNRDELRGLAGRERLRFHDNPDMVQANVGTNAALLACVDFYESQVRSPHCTRDFSTVADARAWVATHPRLDWAGGPGRKLPPEAA